MDSALLFAIGGKEDAGPRAVPEYRPVFEREPQDRAEQRHPAGRAGDGRRPDGALRPLRRRWPTGSSPCRPGRRRSGRELYFSELLPTFDAIKRRADDVLDLNQRNMEDENDRARDGRGRSIRLMVLALLGAAAVATLIAVAAEPVDPGADPGGDPGGPGDGQGRPRPGRARPRPATSWASWPTRSTRWPGRSASSARPGPPGCSGPSRRRRRRSTRSPTRSSSSTRPAPVERANPAARRILGVAPVRRRRSPGRRRPSSASPLAEVLGGRPDHLPTGLEHALCLRDDGQERFFLPRVLAIRGEDRACSARRSCSPT